MNIAASEKAGFEPDEQVKRLTDLTMVVVVVREIQPKCGDLSVASSRNGVDDNKPAGGSKKQRPA